MTKTRAKELISKARQAERVQDLPVALRYFKRAAEVESSAKLVKKITKLEVAFVLLSTHLQKLLKRFVLREDGFYLYSTTGDSVLDPFTETAFFVEASVFSRLYPHQVECIKWMWKLHKENQGGILGDDMGLGKTVQIASMLGSLFYSQLIKMALIVVPKSLISHWQTECPKWFHSNRALVSHST